MLYSQSPPLADNDTAPEEPSGRSARDRDDRSEPRFGRRPTGAAFDALPPPRPRRSLGRRMFRAVSRFAIVLLLGIGGTLGWQAYGDMAKQELAARAPEQAWLLSYLPSTKPPAAVAAAASPALQLEPLAANLEFVRRSVEQIALKQEQMLRNIATLQVIDDDIRQKLSQPPPAPPQPAAAASPSKPAPPKPQAASGALAAPRPAASAAPVSLLPR
ncbi:hypothetical protein [Bradyrhizobium sp.]|uniref:hypothetical protein n=1 Tax=Bradyrhizobium sp. TaxID=376 RepID=UPI00403818BC